MRPRVKEGQGPGAQKLRAMLIHALQQAGLVVEEGSVGFWTQKGSHRHSDCARWGGYFRSCGILRTFTSWDTMTACLKHGIVLDLRSSFASVEIHCKEHRAKTG